MSKISGKETKPEISVRKFLFSEGFRFRKNDTRYPGTPDIVLPKYKTVIFVHGCFWHGHTCKAGKLPQTRRVFWEEKVNSNIARDRKNIALLEDMNWNVIIVWQCELKNKEIRERTLNELVKKIRSSEQ